MLLKSVIGKFHDKKAPISYRDRNWPVRASTEMGIDVVNTVIGFLTAYLKCMSKNLRLRGLSQETIQLRDDLCQGSFSFRNLALRIFLDTNALASGEPVALEALSTSANLKMGLELPGLQDPAFGSALRALEWGGFVNHRLSNLECLVPSPVRHSSH